MLARVRTLAYEGSVLLVAAVASSCGDSTSPPKPTRLAFVTAPATTAETMVPLTTQPVLQTVDASGNPAGGQTTVTATVISGNGSVVANATATTNSTGTATFSNLTLGGVHGAVGPLTLQFGAQGLQSITAAVELHCALFPLNIGQTVSRSLAEGDCAFDNGDYHNVFALTTTQPLTAVRLGLSGSFPGVLLVRGPNEPVYFSGYASAGASNNAFNYKALLPVGRNLISVSSQSQLGSYSISVNPETEDFTCEDSAPLVASPVTTVQQLAAGDCVENSFLEDGVLFGLPPGATLNATMSSSAFDPQMKILDALFGDVVASSTAAGSTGITFQNAGGSGAYLLLLTSSVSNVSGAYTLSFNITYPAGFSAERASFAMPALRPRSGSRTPPWAGGRRTPN